MNPADTSDALDLTKENIRPLRQGRKPIQLETALQAQCSTEVQQKLNKEKEKYEHDIRTYEGDDPLAPRFEYIKWLEQMYLKHGPESNLLPLIEETVQKFKNDQKYKQDPRFVQILIKFIEDQPNAVELYQTVYNQGLGTMCALFYRAWADLLDRYNDIKRVDQIFLLGLQSRAEPREELEQAHVQFQLSVARRMINGELRDDDEKGNEPSKRQAFSVLKKSETHSGTRRGMGGVLGTVPQNNNVNGMASSLKVFEDNDENALLGFDNNNCDLASKGLNKENTVKPGPWTKPKIRSKSIPKPVSSVNFEVHQDINTESVTKLNGITVPNALRSIKNHTHLSCPVAIFEPPDPTKRPMYCKDKVYAAGRDIQIEEIRYEYYLKMEKEKNLLKGSIPQNIAKQPPKVVIKEPVKKVVSPNNDLRVPEFKAPHHLQMEPDPLSQSVTVNTRVALDLVQQMWNSPCEDKIINPPLSISNNRNPVAFAGFGEDKNCAHSNNPSNFMVFQDDGISTKKNENINVYTDNNLINQKRVPDSIDVYVDEDENIFLKKCSITDETSSKNQTTKLKIHVDDNKISSKTCEISVYVDENEVKNNLREKQSKNIKSIPFAVYEEEEPAKKINENKSPFKEVQVTDDDLTCSTKAFNFVLSSSTPLALGGSKTKKVNGNVLKPLKISEETEATETETHPVGKNLSMILEASKERNSSNSSGISSLTSTIKLAQPSKIEFNENINPFDDELINKLLKEVVGFPEERHLNGYLEYDTDVPNMRSEFKLGSTKMSFLNELGKGSYARVVKARPDCEGAAERALKLQKPACAWEWYIGKEIQYRLKETDKITYFVNMDNVYLFNNGSIISMEYATHGTLLSVILTYKQAMNRSIPVTVAALFASQITSAIKYLHQCQIIHGDLKPDNVVVKSLPNSAMRPCIQLIDFGRSIDMTLLPPGTTFTYSVKTAEFICHEMREKLPWTYQTDYYGLAAIIYMLLMADYMKTTKIRKTWVLMKPLPRYMDKDLWGDMLTTLLNVESCNKQPNLDKIIDKLNKYLSIQQKVMLNHQFASLRNTLQNH
ncbi:mitotic checkpoint serine/threonine-protein kinase BUB1-like [Daktulosphaira vitifoliae]|uniref:mitotic checkpoint serine/threonine-protein kinase BUB1-like n=1 Tax=Daktulosphaira vitifoliae TaxID=58002 RepID=UPI0021AAFF34|nr:mitotic checkpoint serine/threonine-protein kinase BUB1-like [Daktulosphaira vitifoliae]